MTAPAGVPSVDVRRVGRKGAVALGGLAALAVAVTTLGGDRVGRTLARADPAAVALVVAVALAVLVLRGLALRVLLGVLGHRVAVRRVLGAYVATVVVNTLVPGGQAGGAPLNGFVVARTADAAYEDGVAAVVTIGVLSNLVVAAAGVVGVGFLLATAAGDGVAVLAALAVALVALVVLALAALWQVRDRVAAVATTLVTTAGRGLRVLPRGSPPDREAVAARIERFGAALARLRAGSTRQLLALVGLLGVAHALTVVALWLSFLAVGQHVPVGVLLAVVPAAVAAAAVPTPGGLGGVDFALVALVTSGTSVVAPVAGAAVLVYRTATSGPALLAGGVVVLAMLSLGWLRDSESSSPDHPDPP